MNISSRCEYACRAVLELALQYRGAQPLTVEHIAQARQIPDKFLIHILLQLKRAEIVRSIRGARGGYMLSRGPETVTLLDIVRAIDGPVLQPLPVRDAGSQDMAPSWREVAGAVEQVLRSVTVQSILERTTKSDMFYI